MTNGWQCYEGSTVIELSAKYESVNPAEVHGWLLDLLPDHPGTILDVGAGPGRDAAWLAAQGYEVVAVEPSAEMLAGAKSRHPAACIRWEQDAVPGLHEVLRLGLVFDVILLSAVWMHVTPADRPRAFGKLVSLLRPGGALAMSLRHGPSEPGRTMHDVSVQEIEVLAKAHAVSVIREHAAEDSLGRQGITWSHVAMRLPDDGTGALPRSRATTRGSSPR